MCLACFDEFFEHPAAPSPPPLTAEMDALATALMEADRSHELEFSGLHIVWADWNLATVHIEYCRHQEVKPLTPAQDDLAARLLALRLPDRYVVMRAATQKQIADDRARR